MNCCNVAVAFRRGSAWGLAGLVKGLGIGSLKKFGILDRIKDATEDQVSLPSCSCRLTLLCATGLGFSLTLLCTTGLGFRLTLVCTTGLRFRLTLVCTTGLGFRLTLLCTTGLGFRLTLVCTTGVYHRYLEPSVTMPSACLHI